MIETIILAREAANGRLAESDRDAHSLRFNELEVFACLVLEAAALACEKRQDNAEESKASQRFREAEKIGDISDAVARGNHWMTVSTVNAEIRNCASAIRALKPTTV